MRKKVILSIAMTFMMSLYCVLPLSAASIVGGVTINDGADTTDKANVNLTLSAGEPVSVTDTDTTQADFGAGTLSKVKPSVGSLQLDTFLDGGFESGNFDKWDSSTGWQIVTNPVASGTKAATATGTPKSLKKSFPSAQKNGYFKCKVNFTENNVYHYLFMPTDQSGQMWLSFIGMSDGYFGYYDGLWRHFPIEKQYQANTWYTIEIYWFGDSHTYRVIIDGTDVTKGGIVAKNSGGASISGVKDINICNTNANGGTGGVVIDDIFITNNINPMIDDGFETGNFNKWSMAGDAWKITSSSTFSGNYAAIMPSGTPSGLSKLFDSSVKNVYISTKQKYPENDKYHYSLVVWTKVGASYILGTNSDGHFVYLDHGSPKYFPVDTQYTVDTWYNIELIINGDTKKFRVIINGVDITSGGLDFKADDGTICDSISGFNIGNTTGGMTLDNVLAISNDPPSVAMTYAFSGSRTSPTVDLTSANTAISSTIDWNAITPTNTSLTVETSLDGGTTWQAVTKGGQIPGIVSGTNLSGKTLLVRQKLNTSNMEVTPQLQDITVTVNGVKPLTGTVEMMICNDSSFEGLEWEPYTSTKNWVLGTTQGTKTVYVKFKDESGNESIVYSDDILYKAEITLEQVYNEIKYVGPKSAFKVVKDKDFTQVIYDQIDGKDKDNTVTATLISVPGTEYKFSVLNGKFTTTGYKAVVINERLLLFYIIDIPSINDTATVTFE